MIHSSEISVIVQGAIDPLNTLICLESIRKHLPEAEVVLSTWENSEISDLEYDKIVLNKDPGAVDCDLKNKIKNNINRQIVSTKNGLLLSQRKYALKIRSDIEIINTNFLSYFNKYDDFRNNDLKVFEKRIVINNLYCADPHKTNFLFHVSDWVQFGLRQDVLNLWDIPPQSDFDMGKYFYNKKRPKIDPVPSWLFRYIPEQYLWISCLKKNSVLLDFQYFTDTNKENLFISELSLANNFVIVNYEDFGIKFLKFNPYKWDYLSQLNHTLWLFLFKDYCNPKFKISFSDKIKNIFYDKKTTLYYKKTKKHLKKSIFPFRNVLRWVSSLFSFLYYFIKLVLKITSKTIRMFF